MGIDPATRLWAARRCVVVMTTWVAVRRRQCIGPGRLRRRPMVPGLTPCGCVARRLVVRDWTGRATAWSALRTSCWNGLRGVGPQRAALCSVIGGSNLAAARAQNGSFRRE